MSNEVKCKYAGDTSDEFCATCNGVYFKEADENSETALIPCSSCGGYEPDTKEETVAPPFEPDNVEVDKTIENVSDSFNEPTSENNVEPINLSSETKTLPQKSNTEPETVPMRTVMANTSISMNLNDAWYKFEYGESRKVAEADVVAARADLWKTVFAEVDNALAETREALGIE